MRVGTIREWFCHGRWANDRILAAAKELPDETLDRKFDMGPGSLRETLRHIYGADRIWFERVGGTNAAAMPHARDLATILQLIDASQKLDDARSIWLAGISDEAVRQPINYKSMKGEPYTNKLCDILLHVCTHGIHHRAQVMAMLRQIGKPLINLDYIFMRIERPTLRLADQRTIDALTAKGRIVGTTLHDPALLCAGTLRYLLAFSDWASEQIFAIAAALDDAALDKEFEFGCGSLRKTLHHIVAAESGWLANWRDGARIVIAPPQPGRPVSDIKAEFDRTTQERRAYLEGLDDASLHREITADGAEGIRLYLRLGEVILQVAGHGMHHRAQALNMLRRVGAMTPALDMIGWARQRGSA